MIVRPLSPGQDEEGEDDSERPKRHRHHHHRPRTSEHQTAATDEQEENGQLRMADINSEARGGRRGDWGEVSEKDKGRWPQTSSGR